MESCLHRKALETKAAIYDKLSKGQGLQEVEGQDGEESRYMVDFTRKVYEEVSTQTSSYYQSRDNIIIRFK